MLDSTAGKFEITEFQVEDLAAVFELEQLCFKDPYPWWLLSELSRKNPDTFIVASLDSKIVGYAVVDKWDEDRQFHLVSIAVHPNERRRGVATMMLRNLETRLSPGLTLRLEVRKSNDAATNFYSKHNFIRTGTISGYYSDGEDAIVMEKRTVGA